MSKISISFTITGLLVLTGFFGLINFNFEPVSAYTTRYPIYIVGNENFTEENGVITGVGTIENPYVISGWKIEADWPAGIAIKDTTAYFTIQENYIWGWPSQTGVYLHNVSNGIIQANTCDTDLYGYYIDKCDSIIIWGNIRGLAYVQSSSEIDLINNDPIGIDLINCSNTLIENNQCWINLESSSNNHIFDNNCGGINIISSSQNVIFRNDVSSDDYGIFVLSSSNNTILDNNITTSENGIFLQNSMNNTLRDNYVNSNNWDGIVLDSSSNNDILENIVSTNLRAGLTLRNSSGNDIFDNLARGNTEYGIYLHKNSENNTLTGNTARDNYIGIHLESGSNNNTIEDCSIHDNLYGLYTKESSNNTLLTNSFANEFTCMYLKNTMNDEIYGNDISGSNDEGILLISSSNVSIAENTVKYSYQGIVLEDSHNNTITENNASFNTRAGYYLYNSNKNTITNNTAYYNNEHGIYLGLSEYNTFVNNTLEKNGYGMHPWSSDNNRIYHNNFISNTYHVNIVECKNHWDDGYPSGGNYWSGYTGLDLYHGPVQDEPGSDNIGDSPYILDENNYDNYPLISMSSKKIPYAPRNLEAVTGDSFVKLTWEPPKKEGSSPVTNYRIYRSTSPGHRIFLTDTVHVLSYNDTKVTNGDTYYYKVSAKNLYGESPPSNEVNATPATVPSKPTSLKITSGKDYIRLNWDAPFSNGGSPVTNFKVYKGVTTGVVKFLVELDEATTYKDTEVSVGIYYYYKVSAVNDYGEGERSNEESSIIATIPTVPTAVTATAGDSFVYLTWSEPEFDGGYPINRYNIYRSKSSGVEVFLEKVWSDINYFNDTGVTNGVRYYYKIGAENSVGESPLSAEVSAVPGKRINSPPTASIGANITSGKPPLRVAFTGYGTDLDGTIVSYLWDFDDGDFSELQNPSHRFEDAGTYYVKLTVVDNDGATSLAMVTITVKEDLPPDTNGGPDEPDGGAAGGDKEGRSPWMLAAGAAVVFVLLIIMIFIIIPMLLKRRSKKETVPRDREVDDETEEVPGEAEVEDDYQLEPPLTTPPKATREASKPVKIFKPRQKKQQYFDEPPEVRPHLTQLLEAKTAMIRFHCSYCDRKSVIQVSKDYHSVICPFCEEETPIGPED